MSRAFSIPHSPAKVRLTWRTGKAPASSAGCQRDISSLGQVCPNARPTSAILRLRDKEWVLSRQVITVCGRKGEGDP